MKKVFVGGLKDHHEDEDLQQYFSQFGNVASVTRYKLEHPRIEICRLYELESRVNSEVFKT